LAVYRKRIEGIEETLIIGGKNAKKIKPSVTTQNS
jgi:hypothetical protein